MTSSTSLYNSTPGNANVASQNFTTLYSGSGTINPTQAYGNANVVSLLATSTDGGNTIGNISATGNVTAVNFIGNFVGNITANVTIPGGNTQVLFNNAGVIGTDADFTFNNTTNTLSVAGNVSTPTVYSQGIQTQGYDYVQMQYSNGVALPVSPYDIGVGSWFYLDAGGGVFQSNTTGTLQTVQLGNGGTISATGNVTAPNFIGNVSGNIGAAGSNTQIQFNTGNVLDASANLTFDKTTSTIKVLGNATFPTSGLEITANTITGNVALGNLLITNQFQGTSRGPVVIDTNELIVGQDNAGLGTNATVRAIRNQALELTTTNAGAPAVYVGKYVSGNPSLTGNVDTRSSNVGGYAGTGNINLTGNVYVSRSAQGADPVNAKANLIVSDGVYVGQGISAAGNITGNVFTGNGSGLTNINASNIIGAYGNANVSNFLANGFGSNTIVTTGNITSGNLITSSLTGNGTGNLTISTLVDANVTIRQSSAVNGTGAVYVDANNLIIGNVGNSSKLVAATSNDLILAVSGTGGPQMYVGQATTGNLDLRSSGSAISGGFAANGNINLSGNVFIGNAAQQTAPASTGLNLSVAGNITGSVFTGNGSGLTALTGANVSGTVANATYALNANASTFAGTVTTAAQPNITSVGILTAVNTSGNISATGNITANYFIGNGSQLTGVSATDAIHATTLRFPVKNTSGGTLAQNTPVYVTGSVGATETLEVSASRADTAATMPCIGLLETALGVNAFGYAVAIGSLSSTNTSTYTIGQTLYVAPTGGLTQSRPTNANAVQSVGAAGRINASTGQIEVNIWNQEGLPNLGSGNVWIGNAAAYPTQTVLATYSGNIGAGNLSVTGNTTSGNLLTGGVVSATGNIIGGNLVIVPGTGAGNIDLVSSQAFTTVTTTNNPARIIFGSGYTGNADAWSVNYDPYSRMRQAGVLVNNRVTRGDGAINTTGLTNIYQQEFTANITTATTRNFAAINFLHVGGGASAFRSTVTSPATFVGQNSFVQAGTNGNVAVGNVVIGSGTGGIFGVQTNSGAQIGNAFGTLSSFQASDTTGNVVNAIGFSSWPVSLSGTLTAPTNFNSFYHPSGTATYGGLFTNAAFRAATNYYAFKNDDNVAQVQLGSLRSYNEFQYSTATSGTVNINKTNAQVQFIAPTANVTIGDFQNFVTTANDSVNNDNQTDTVTLIIQQGATPYTVTMPTGNASIKYLGGTTTVGSTANAVSIVTIKAVRSAANAALYLASISSEYT